MRRKPGTLLPLELSILEAAIDLRRRGEEDFHGFAVAKEIREREDARSLTAHGTLYKALERMQRMGLLESRWENPDAAAAEGRPRRRLYRMTGLGEQALTVADAAPAGPHDPAGGRARAVVSGRALRLAAGLTRGWVRVYTRGLPAELRSARRAELESDLDSLPK